MNHASLKQSLFFFIVGVLSFVSIQNAVAQSDLDVLNYALVLEHLEYAFYRDGIALLNRTQRPGFQGKLYPRLIQIRDHEEAHVQTLISVIQSLGGTPVQECTYDFGYKTGAEFLAVARVLENVGVSAYTGAAYLLQNEVLLTAAATIATIEARHASYLNSVNKVDPFPNAFDSPLDMKAVVGLASGFITSCPDNITITPYPKLTVTPTSVTAGSTVRVVGVSADPTNATIFCVFYSGSVSVNSTLEVPADNSTARCDVPEEAAKGDNFLFAMTNQTYELTNSAGILGGPALIVVK
jgi:hypothetical protein